MVDGKLGIPVQYETPNNSDTAIVANTNILNSNGKFIVNTENHSMYVTYVKGIPEAFEVNLWNSIFGVPSSAVYTRTELSSNILSLTGGALWNLDSGSSIKIKTGTIDLLDTMVPLHLKQEYNFSVDGVNASTTKIRIPVPSNINVNLNINPAVNFTQISTPSGPAVELDVTSGIIYDATGAQAGTRQLQYMIVFITSTTALDQLSRPNRWMHIYLDVGEHAFIYLWQGGSLRVATSLLHGFRSEDNANSVHNAMWTHGAYLDRSTFQDIFYIKDDTNNGVLLTGGDITANFGVSIYLSALRADTWPDWVTPNYGRLQHTNATDYILTGEYFAPPIGSMDISTGLSSVYDDKITVLANEIAKFQNVFINMITTLFDDVNQIGSVVTWNQLQIISINHTLEEVEVSITHLQKEITTISGALKQLWDQVAEAEGWNESNWMHWATFGITIAATVAAGPLGFAGSYITGEIVGNAMNQIFKGIGDMNRGDRIDGLRDIILGIASIGAVLLADTKVSDVNFESTSGS
jgi:hypothetical protein